MGAPLITIEHLSKRYFLAKRSTADGLRHLVEETLTRPFRTVRADRPESADEFWALNDISCEFRTGEVVGVIGRNGAGKSTLLKIISRITEPTAGTVRLRGRVASLLEVGTGFHPELTGAENIFLNGAILGMSRREIRAKFDEIVAFAEVERFLQTPVKRYSSGMYVRLAFAVAAHLEPEILLVDEVLAVGDAAFQKKCLGKMKNISSGDGRTVLFVSHSMPAVTQLCTRALLLDQGRLQQDGTVEDVVAEYLRDGSLGRAALRNEEELRVLRDRKKLFFSSVELVNSEGQRSREIDVRHSFSLKVEYEVPRTLSRIEMSARVLTADGRAVMTTLQSGLSPEALEAKKEGRYSAEIKFPGMFFMPGAYFINVAAHHPVGEIFDLHENAVQFTVQDTGTNFAPYQNYQSIGVVLRDLPWVERKL